MTGEKYNGWTNWDTCAAYSWLSNDEYSYKKMRAASGLPRFEHQAQETLLNLGNPDDIDFDNVNWNEVEGAFADE